MAHTITAREMRGDRRRWLALAALVIAGLVLGLDMTIVVTALPTISARLAATETDLQWISGAYTLTLAVFLVPAGVLGDRFGRKRVLVVGLLLFGVGSVIASRAGTATELIWMRALMGIGGAIVMPLSLSILPTVFTEEERPRAVGITAASVMLGIPLGPLVSGWLLTHFEWGSIFLVNAPVVALGVVGVLLFVPETRDPNAPRLDWPGAGLLIVGMTALVYGIIEQPVLGWADLRVARAGLGGLGVLALFVLWELTTRTPLIDLRLFRSRRFLWGTVAFVIVGFAMMGVMFVLSPFLQVVQGTDAQGTGIRLLPMIGAILAGALVSDRLTSRFGSKVVVAAGLLIMAGGLVVLSRAGADTGYGIVAVALVIVGAGLGIGMPPAMDAVLGSLPEDQTGTGTGIARSLQNLASTLGPSVLGSILANTYGADLDPHLRDLPATVRAAARGSVSGAAAVANRLPAASGRPLLRAAADAYANAMSEVLLLSCGVAIVGVVLVLLFLPGRAPATAGQP